MKHVLIVDDDKSILKYMRTVLEKKGYIVSTAETGKEARRKCDGNSFDIALIDIKISDMEGTELLEKIRDKLTLKIIITGFPSQKNAIDSLNLGADSYIVKPIKPKKLLKVIEENLRRHQEGITKTQEKNMTFRNLYRF